MTRLCTIPGCQSLHRARGWCAKHHKRWLKHGDPMHVAPRVQPGKPGYVTEMEALAAEGLSRSDIAAITGWSVQTVGKHVGRLVPSRHRDQRPDLPRYRRMLLAAQASDASRSDIASRFGLANAKTLSVTLVTARRRIAEAEGETR